MYVLNGVEISIDSWPMIPTYAEIEGKSDEDVTKYINWCYKKHLDINNLIPMELAIDATGLNIY